MKNIKQNVVHATLGKKVRLTKLSDDAFEGNHPNGIFEGYTKEGIETKEPTIGERYYLGGFSTSPVVKICKDVGAYIVLHSCCDESRHHDMLEYCEKIDLKIDAINETPIKLPYDKSNKPYCNIYLDDRAGLNEALVILEEAMYNQRIHNNQIKFNNLNDIA